MARAKARKAAGKSSLWLQGVVCGIAATALPGAAAMLAVLLAPGLAMLVTDTAPGRPTARAILLVGAASTFMPLRLLWEHGGTLDAAIELLGDPTRLLISWLCCGAGWFLGEIAEIAARFVLQASTEHEIRGLRREKEALEKEWTGADAPVARPPK